VQARLRKDLSRQKGKAVKKASGKSFFGTRILCATVVAA